MHPNFVLLAASKKFKKEKKKKYKWPIQISEIPCEGFCYFVFCDVHVSIGLVAKFNNRC